jgi:hypothetical protein
MPFRVQQVLSHGMEDVKEEYVLISDDLPAVLHVGRGVPDVARADDSLLIADDHSQAALQKIAELLVGVVVHDIVTRTPYLGQTELELVSSDDLHVAVRAVVVPPCVPPVMKRHVGASLD